MANKPNRKRPRIVPPESTSSSSSDEHAEPTPTLSWPTPTCGIAYVPSAARNYLGSVLTVPRLLARELDLTSPTNATGLDSAGGSAGGTSTTAASSTANLRGTTTSTTSSAVGPGDIASVSAPSGATTTVTTNTDAQAGADDFPHPYNLPHAPRAPKSSSKKGPLAPPAARALGQWLCCTCMRTTCWFNVAGKRCQREGCPHLKCECCLFLGRALGIQERVQQVREARVVVEKMKEERERRERAVEGVVGGLVGLGLREDGEEGEGEGEHMDESAG
ncbi:uncharacterized protein K452DRAFT_339544 [Aplosporella prunicola CBS 121167]|uniref:Uncharacterized protein n=1 Tax=Aplosporella prunicola CBS 121167 TaxID=1176127 RepID=A0A6A6B139_9PEZI|nr:uncharacterized protein K452DRAFT_339544 [Aplosporella prunicola CBS 121167]KAF2137879.1 hypothetical protein K452DRAFT_339544 [Aplosporella prunicola CBS 121167]